MIYVKPVKLIRDYEVPQKYRYCIILRYSLKSFPKHLTNAQYESKFKKLFKKYKVDVRSHNWYSAEYRSRQTVEIYFDAFPSKADKIVKSLLNIQDNILRTVQLVTKGQA